MAATKEPYIIKAVQCFLRMKVEPYKIRKHSLAHLYISRQQILVFSIKAESVSNQVELSKPLRNNYWNDKETNKKICVMGKSVPKV